MINSQRFDHLSPAKQALLRARLARQEEADRHQQKIPTRAPCDTLPLSFAQERIWLHQQLVPGSVAYNRPTNIRMRGPLRVESLRQALEQVVSRHESLRTTVRWVEGAPALHIHSPVPLEMPLTDLSGEPSPGLVARQMAQEEACCPFDLEQGPLLRSHLLRISHKDHLLLLTFHHFTFDAWSQVVLLEELMHNYDSSAAGVNRPSKALSIQYADFAAWDRSPRRVAALGEGRSYWRRELADPPVLQLPTDFPRVSDASEETDHAKIIVRPELVSRLRQLAGREQTTLFAVLLASFTALLHRYTGDNDIVVGCPVAGRNRLETEPLIGVFINTLPLRTSFAVDDTFRQLLQRVRESVIHGLHYQEVPLQFIVQDVLTDRDLSGSPLFQAMFIHERLPLQPGADTVLSFEPEDNGPVATTADLSLELMESSSTVGGYFVYRLGLWEKATIERMVGHFVMLLEGVAADADRRVGEIPLLTDAERQQLLVEWNDTAVAYPHDRCVHELFEQQAERTPHAVAVVCEEQKLTYRELNGRANQLAHHLRSLGVGPETLVGLCLKRSPELVISILGVLKAGGAYAPLDAAYPHRRLQFMLADAKAEFLVTQHGLLDRLPRTDCNTICLDAEAESIGRHSDSNLESPRLLENLAYLINTSGSTGQPKGTLLTHRGLLNLVRWHVQAYKLTSTDRTTLIASPAFDASVWETWPSLVTGATLHVPADEVRLSPELLARWFAASGVTVSFVPTALAEELLRQCWPQQLGLRVLLTGGEKLVHHPPPGLPFELVNHYGPTECTVVATSARLGAGQPGGAQPSIGRPIENTQVYVLDEGRQPVPIGVPGELCIGGAGLARGYLNRPELTAEKFVPDPFSDDPDSRLYRTGDRCRWRADGNLEFLGRLDHQVKLRGYRIELGEIEAVLNGHAAVAQSLVTLREDRPGDKRLVAYVVAPPDTSTDELRSFLKPMLPEFMIPSTFVYLDSLPLTSSGKMDRRALPAPDQSSPKIGEICVGPRAPLEERLASIWAEALNLEAVGIHDNFFEIGGHSLLIAQVHRRLCGVLGRSCAIVDLFRYPTISSLANFLSEENAAQSQVHHLEERAQRRKSALARRKKLSNDDRAMD